jgi:purine-binding chemotaxis protein CheW
MNTGGDPSLVVFSIDGELYALPVASVREIIRYRAPSATAAVAPDGPIEGMINLHGQVVPVVDLARRLGRAGEGREPRASSGVRETDGATRILVIEISKGSLGVIVDDVHGVRQIPAAQITPLPVAITARGIGEHIATVGDDLIVLIDPERALGSMLVSATARRRRKSGSS